MSCSTTKQLLFSRRVLWDSLYSCSFQPTKSDAYGCLGVAAEVGADWAIELLGHHLVAHDLEVIAVHAERKGNSRAAALIRALECAAAR